MQAVPGHLGAQDVDVHGPVQGGAEVAARGRPCVVYARDLLPTLWDVGRPGLLRLLSMLLRSGDQAHLDVPRSGLAPEPGRGVPLHRPIGTEMLAAEMAGYGLRIDETHQVDETEYRLPWRAGDDALPKTRMVVSWQRATR